MALTYFKRFQMELDLTTWIPPSIELPHGYQFIAWSESELSEHAKVKFQSFELEIDAHVFPCLSELSGCTRLMNDICRRDQFVAEATWLIEYQADEASDVESVGTIQVLLDIQGRGTIQNIAIIPEHRQRGLGTALVHQSLVSLQQRGIRCALLEVTAQNAGALRLYKRLGFRIIKTVFKPSTAVTQ